MHPNYLLLHQLIPQELTNLVYSFIKKRYNERRYFMIYDAVNNGFNQIYLHNDAFKNGNPLTINIDNLFLQVITDLLILKLTHERQT